MSFDEKKWAVQAMQVQDACNLSGVLISFSKMLSEMNDDNYDTLKKQTHPCTILFTSKVESLVRSEAPGAFSKAWSWAKDKAGAS